jgi:phage shock protein C
MERRLYRSRSHSMIAGVCGGLGQYLRIDPTLVRVLFVVLALGNGIGVLLYLMLWIVLPREGEGEPGTRATLQAGAEELAGWTQRLGDELRQRVAGPDPRTMMILGAALIFVGLIYLLHSLDFAWTRWLHFEILWPLLLIGGGLALILRRMRGG